MKGYILFLSSFFLIISRHFTQAEETNRIYVTESSHISIYREIIDNYHSNFYTQTVKERESLPAKDFSEGNWGAPVYGLQISLRLTKSSYTNGERIPAIVLVRNITNSVVYYAPSHFGFGDDPVPLIVTTKDGHLLERFKPGPIVSNGGVTLFPLTQFKYQEFVSAYNLTNNSYLVYASVKIPFEIEENGRKIFAWHEAKSADVQIKIESTPSKN